MKSMATERREGERQLKLTVLGSCGTFPWVNGACSGYLLQDGRTNILVDCGSGVMSRVQRYCRIEEIDAIILSHLHLDHISDVFLFKYAMETKREKGQVFPKTHILLPSTPAEAAKELYDNDLFHMTNIHENMEISIGDFKVSFAGMPHLIESYAVLIRHGDKKLAYSGDMGQNDKIREIAKGVDLFLCESTLLESGGDSRSGHHFSAGMAGRAAAACGAKKLLLTHFWFEEDRQKYLEEASRYFDNVFLAGDFASYSI